VLLSTKTHSYSNASQSFGHEKTKFMSEDKMKETADSNTAIGSVSDQQLNEVAAALREFSANYPAKERTELFNSLLSVYAGCQVEVAQ